MALRFLLFAMLMAPASGLSSLMGTTWNLKLNVGLEPGSYLARTNWGASEGRLIVNARVCFDEAMSTANEELVGPLSGTRVLSIDDGASTFVSLDGVITASLKPHAPHLPAIK